MAHKHGSSVRAMVANILRKLPAALLAGSILSMPTYAQMTSSSINKVIVLPSDGNTDVAELLRAQIASDAINVVPPGIYNLCSTETSPYAVGPIAVWVKNHSNFTLDLRGVTFIPCDDITQHKTGISYFLFDNDTNYSVIGGSFFGKPGSIGISVGISSFNDVNFSYMGQSFTGDWSNAGAAYDGDFLVNGTFDNAYMPNVSFCFDMAFLQNVTFKNFVASGKFGTNPGSSCVSIIYDIPSVGKNTTGFVINDTTNVRIKGGYATNFNAGWHIASGSQYNLSNNHWYANKGQGITPGIGGLINYNAGGNASSVGHPPQHLLISGDKYDNNGSGVSGDSGIYILNDAISNGDVIDDIHVEASFNNNSGVGIEAGSSSHLSKIVINISCNGAAQKLCIGSSLLTQVHLSSNVPNTPQ
jgi:hypothetical protein